MAVTSSECTAIHESAHAVIYLLFEIELDEVTVWEDGGVCFVAGDPPPSYERLLATLAGRESDKLLLIDEPHQLRERESGWKGDLDLAQELVRQLGSNYSLEAAALESARLVRDNWSVIRSLGESLISGLKRNLEEDADRYMMLGYQIKQHVDAFRAALRAEG